MFVLTAGSEFDFLIMGVAILLGISVFYEMFIKNFSNSGTNEKKDEGKKNEKNGGEAEKKEPAVKSSGMPANTSSLLWIVFAAIIGRIALSWVPSVEPVIPLAVFAGLVAGPAYGALIGAAGYFGSNLFMPYGLSAMWWVWQSIGGALAGFIAGVAILGRKPESTDLLLFTAIGTLLFNVVVSVGGSLGLNVGYLMSSAAFIGVHLVTNIVIAIILSLFLKSAVESHESN